MTTLHVLGNFEQPTNLDTRIEPFSIATYWFIKYMAERGWNMIHYGHPDSKPLCEFVPIPYVGAHEANLIANAEIQKRKKPGDMILCFYGAGNAGATQDNTDLKIIEPSIGYSCDAVFAPYRVFTSYAHQHMYYGQNRMLMNPSWFDAVIPNGFELDEFEFCEQKDDYLLYFGRVIGVKGVELCMQLAQRTGHRLVIAGPGNLSELGINNIPSFVDVVGPCNADQRRALMSRAKALLGPTYYVEPFGNMVVEAQLSGTPTITTDWGGFTETNINGVTGYRCRDWNDFVHAVNNIDKIDPKVCRAWAESRYSNAVVHDQFDRYLRKVMHSNFYAEEVQ